MCDRCADIDYPIGDPIWLPCGGPASRYTSRSRVGTLPPLTPNRYLSDEHYDMQTKVNDLMATIRRQRTEIASLKLKAAQSEENGEKFEGI